MRESVSDQGECRTAGSDPNATVSDRVTPTRWSTHRSHKLVTDNVATGCLDTTRRNDVHTNFVTHVSVRGTGVEED
jgi:hypothetical protein